MNVTNSPKKDLLSAKAACLLALEDGTVFWGENFGAAGTSCGEIVFNTSMTGYQEILTDPSYAGQVIALTCPEVGNYGTNDEDYESTQIYARGLVVRHLARSYSNWRAKHSLPEFLKRFDIIGISGVDTRALTRHIRDKGAMRCALSTEILDERKLTETAATSAQMAGADFTAEVTTPKTYKLGGGRLKVAVLDYGVKKNILNSLTAQGFALTIYPANTKSAVVLADKPDGIFLSNGPGDPAACEGVLKELPALVESRIPMFGICLGHQLLAITLGAKTCKLKFGHHGANQPVKDLGTSKVEITCQNHGFAVDGTEVPAGIELTHVNLNDNSVEGFRHKSLPIFCVQYHPEASPGPHDSGYLFERFRKLIEARKNGGA